MVEGNGFPVRVGKSVVRMQESQINAIKQQALMASAEARSSSVGLEALDGELIGRAMKGARSSTQDPVAYLLARRLAHRHGAKVILREAAVLLFAGEAQTIANPHSGVRIFRVEGVERRHGAAHNVGELPRIEGRLPWVITEVHRVLSEQIRWSARLHDLFFREVPEYPTFAWQEAIVNAVAHRDYGIATLGIEVWLFDDRMEVFSPGGLVAGVTIEDLNRRARVHASRNPLVVRGLVDLGFMREQGEGIPRMIEEMEESYLPLPGFEAAEHQFTVTLRNTPILESADPAWAGYVKGLPLTVRQKRILVARGWAEFTNGDYQELNRVDRDLAYRELRELVDLGLIRPSRGRGRGARYRVIVSSATAVTIVDPGRRRLASAMQEQGFVTNTDVRNAFDVDRTAAKRMLTTLTTSGVLGREGKLRGTKYRTGSGWGIWLQGVGDDTTGATEQERRDDDTDTGQPRRDYQSGT